MTFLRPPRAAWSSSQRIVGLDVARGLAILGMLAAHALVLRPIDAADPTTWGAIVQGRSAIMFAVLAGVSIAIMSGGARPVSGQQLVRVRLRIAIRAVVLFGLGGLLASLNTNVYVILEYYSVLFVLALPFLRWRPRSILILAAVLTVVMPVAQLVLSRARAGWDLRPTAIIELVIEGNYPAMIWIVFLLVGLAVGRLDLRGPDVLRMLFLLGSAASLVGYSAGELSAAIVPRSAGSVYSGTTFDWSRLLDISALATTAPHSGSPFEIVGSTGLAVAILALCVMTTRRAFVLVVPLAATGSMALSAYTAQIIVFAVIQAGAGADRTGGWSVFITLAVITLAASTLWAYLVGPGPLERGLSVLSARAARSGEPAGDEGRRNSVTT
jgi:uncharacterized membrane protein YeiB